VRFRKLLSSANEGKACKRLTPANRRRAPAAAPAPGPAIEEHDPVDDPVDEPVQDQEPTLASNIEGHPHATPMHDGEHGIGDFAFDDAGDDDAHLDPWPGAYYALCDTCVCGRPLPLWYWDRLCNSWVT
jgi:hypothetical protein